MRDKPNIIGNQPKNTRNSVLEISKEANKITTLHTFRRFIDLFREQSLLMLLKLTLTGNICVYKFFQSFTVHCN